MSNPFQTHGAFSWNELAAPDVESAKRFYGEVLGWKIEEVNMPSGTYNMIYVDGESIGGIIPRSGAAPAWGVYVTVGDVDDVASKVEQWGGKRLSPISEAPGVGRFCVVQDPQGAQFTVMTYIQQG